MPKFIVDLSLDGYNSKLEEEEACLVFIEEQLNFSASSVKVKKYISEKEFRNAQYIESTEHPD